MPGRRSAAIRSDTQVTTESLARHGYITGNSNMSTTPIPFATALHQIGCTLDARSHDERRAALETLFSQADERQDLPDGVRYRFAGRDDTLASLFGLIAAERTCCSALRLTLRVEPEAGPLWLEITGPAPAVAALQQVFSAAKA